MSFSLLISKAPVLALFGEFGSGKTSFLNLLRKHLEKKAIVVSFSTWLPGSPEALASYLLSDIAQESSKDYIVPGIRKDSLKLAGALAKSIPKMDALSELFSETTQKQDIDALGDAISRLPKRVVVLLDEVDRMQKEEILALLKVVRGISASANLSFVYAFDREIVERAVLGNFDVASHNYFEKFFPLSISLPNLDSETLMSFGIRRIVSVLNRRNWFDVPADEEKFEKELKVVWMKRIAPFCETLRALSLLANNVGTAAAPLKGEVNPIELTLIELLRQFEPTVYEIIWRYRDIMTGGEDWTSPSYQYRNDTEKATLSKRMSEEINNAVPNAARLDGVKTILHGMFPLFADIDRGGRTPRFTPNPKDEVEKSIADPRLISAYFRYKLPEDLFRWTDMNAFLRCFEEAPQPSKRQVFSKVLNSMQKGESKRSNFLDKLSDKTNSVDVKSARDLAMVCVLESDTLAYDGMFIAVGEAGHVLRIVIRAASRLEGNERVKLLSDCIEAATDDTLAFRIQTALSKPGRDFDLSVSFAELYPSFIRRMRFRYGPNVNATDIDLTPSEPQAFNLWGWTDLSKEGVVPDPEDRVIQHSFWLRYIGNNASRLAYAFRIFFLPKGLYPNDPRPFVENKIPIDDLRRLYENLLFTDDLSEVDQKSLRRLEKFLAGEFNGGINFGNPDLEDQ